MKILVVDHSATMRQIVRRLLENEYDVEDTHCGESALKLLRSKPFGLVLCDWSMAPVTGLQLLNTIRTDRALSVIPFITMIAQEDVASIPAAKRAGANDVLVKPFGARTLRLKIIAARGLSASN